MIEFLHSPWGIFVEAVVCAISLSVLSIVFYRNFFKRFYDILLSGLALILLSPLFLVLALLVRVKLGAPVLFRQVRPGKDGKIFTLHKFRSMTSACDEEGNLLPDEERMTEFGRKLRESSLDELPELWDIFTGRMSIIGPRPQLVRDLVFMDYEIKGRHQVRPGLTGLAQVSGRNNLTWEERFSHDLAYVRNVNLFTDAKIFFLTIGKVLRRKDVSTEGLETSEDYGDYLLRTGKIDEEEYLDRQQMARNLLQCAKK